jgi:hypothetical protein
MLVQLRKNQHLQSALRASGYENSDQNFLKYDNATASIFGITLTSGIKLMTISRNNRDNARHTLSHHIKKLFHLTNMTCR